MKIHLNKIVQFGFDQGIILTGDDIYTERYAIDKATRFSPLSVHHRVSAGSHDVLMGLQLATL